MKKFTLFFVIMTLVAMLVPSLAFAQEVVAAAPPLPEWANQALAFIASLPVVGPYVLIAAKYLGIIGGVLTVVSTALVMLRAALAPLAVNMAFVDKILPIMDKIIFYAKFLSMYNVKK